MAAFAADLGVVRTVMEPTRSVHVIRLLLAIALAPRCRSHHPDAMSSEALGRLRDTRALLEDFRAKHGGYPQDLSQASKLDSMTAAYRADTTSGSICLARLRLIGRW